MIGNKIKDIKKLIYIICFKYYKSSEYSKDSKCKANQLRINYKRS